MRSYRVNHLLCSCADTSTDNLKYCLSCEGVFHEKCVPGRLVFGTIRLVFGTIIYCGVKAVEYTSEIWRAPVCCLHYLAYNVACSFIGNKPSLLLCIGFPFSLSITDVTGQMCSLCKITIIQLADDAHWGRSRKRLCNSAHQQERKTATPAQLRWLREGWLFSRDSLWFGEPGKISIAFEELSKNSVFFRTEVKPYSSGSDEGGGVISYWSTNIIQHINS